MSISPQQLNDEAIVLQVQLGNSDLISELVVRYTPVVAYYAKRFSGAGPELEDLMQEGMIALLSAVRTYHHGEQASFKTYASRCVNNKLITAITAYHRGKNMPLNTYMPIDEVEITSPHRLSDPQEMFILKEEENLRRQQMTMLLSEFEMNSLQLYLSGHSYEEIAKELSCSNKSIDNALQRVRKKLQSEND